MMKKLVLGIDISTQGAKIVALDLKRRSQAYVDKINYDKDLAQYGTKNGIIVNKDCHIGSAESDPIMWLDALNLLFVRMLKSKDIDIENIKAISVSGQQHGLVCIDKNGNLSRKKAKLWNDYTTEKECRILTDFVGGKEKMIDEVANALRAGYTASKILDLVKNENQIYKKTSAFLLPHNFINWYLTGGIFAMEYGDTSGTGLWNPVSKRWSKKLVNFIAGDLKLKLPQVKPPTQPIGKISKELVAKYGFAVDCIIDAGSGDNMYGAIGTGNVKNGIVTISLGTSGTAYTYMSQPYIDPEGEIACFCDSTGNYLPLLCVSNMANSYNEFLESNALTHKNFEDLISESDPGNNGNMIIPWFEGERTPDIPDACATYFGFKPRDLNKANIARGILEGTIQNLYNGFKKLPLKPNIIHLTGGLSQSKSWCQAVADIFNCETINIKGEGAALGAAIHAAWVLQMQDGKDMDIAEVCEPYIEFNLSMLHKPRDKFKNTYNAQKKLFGALTKKIKATDDGQNLFELKNRIIFD